MKMNKNQFKDFFSFENHLNSLSIAKEKGDFLEKLAKNYFNLNKDLYQIENCYDSLDVPDKILTVCKLQSSDYGVDLFIKFKDGQPRKYALVQVKYRNYHNNSSITRNDIATFLDESSYSFENNIAERIVFTNLESIMSRQDDIAYSRGIKKILRENLTNLPEHYFNFETSTIPTKIPISPDPHQIKAINNIIEGFSNGNERGKYLSACGTGKTLTALWLIEKMDVKKALFIVPSLALIQQTLEEWSKHSKEPFRYLCVCSDETVVNQEDDYGSTSLIPHTTTDTTEINEFLNQSFHNTKVIFSTYQSLDRVKETLADNDFEFDLTIFDEAHRTATGSLNSNFSMGLSNSNIKSINRLFMTATERILKARRVTGGKQEEFFSMNDEILYGPIFDQLTFRDAIEQGIIAEYEIVWLGIDDRQILDIILEQDHDVEYLNENMKEVVEDAFNLVKKELLIKAYQELEINKTFVFKKNIATSKEFIQGVELNRIDKDLYKAHIDGTMNGVKRKRIFHQFSDNKKSILSNARCLTEGVDVPNVDCIYFADPKSSLVSIVQACGRGLRKPRHLKEKRTKILLPIVQLNLEDDIKNQNFEIIKEIRNNDFVKMFDIIQALRDSDQLLAEKINELHRSVSTGVEGEIKFKIITSSKSKIDIDNFRKELSLKIARYNATDSSWEGFTPINIGTPGYVKAGDTIKLSPIADYSIVGLTKLIKRSLEILHRDFKNNEPFAKADLHHAYHPLKPNGEHNRFSHCERINIFKFVSDDNYQLNEGGENLLNSLNSSNFEKDVIKQIRSVVMDRNELKYYPYQAILKILEEVKSINYIHYLYGLNSMNGVSDNDIANVVAIIQELDYDYELLTQNSANAELVWKELNKKYLKSYTINDFMFRGTFKNKFNSYFKNHLLALFQDKILYDAAKKELKIKT